MRGVAFNHVHGRLLAAISPSGAKVGHACLMETNKSTYSRIEIMFFFFDNIAYIFGMALL